MAMICRRCHNENPDSAHYCLKCGTHLAHRPPASRKMPPWYLVVAGAVALLAAGFFLSTVVFKAHRSEGTRGAPSAAAPEISPQAARPERDEAGPVAGYVVVEKTGGRESARWTAAALNDTWVALPAAALLDGDKLTYFGAGGAEPSPIERAVWSDREPVVLCRLETTAAGKALRLSPWRRDIQLLWRSLEQDHSLFFLGQIAPGRSGSFLFFLLAEEIRKTGLLMQDESVVGWTFGGATTRGYLWDGARDIAQAPTMKVSELAGTVLADGREARFARALALENNVPSAAKLRAFAEAFRSNPRLDDGDTPPRLRPQAAVDRMHVLASELIRDGAAAEVIRLFDDALLMETKSVALLKDAVLARVKWRDHESAVPELARLGKKIFNTPGGPPAELTEFERQLYKDWLKEILDRRGSGGLEAFEKAKLAFPDDVDIHLLGVEVAIAEKNWSRATEFLGMRQYPDSLSARVKMLENLIQEGQKDEGVAVLRFDPGTDHIPVQAYVNGKAFQKFIIDTGATTSSIPSSALDVLGIKIDDSSKVVVIQGIVGEGLSVEVTLDSVELAGLRVYNVKAFIADLPSYDDTGLLGQNFLNNFQLDIDYKKGILRIKKR